MKLERTASPSMIDANRAAVAPDRVRPAVKHHFMPISKYETRMFAALEAKEHLAETSALVTGRKPRLPRFSLLRGK